MNTDESRAAKPQTKRSAAVLGCSKRSELSLLLRPGTGALLGNELAARERKERKETSSLFANFAFFRGYPLWLRRKPQPVHPRSSVAKMLLDERNLKACR
jgi:hypothetical protein